jgi:ABC-type methionine transport system permease subunit
VLLSRSPTTFVVVKSMLGPITTIVTLSIAWLWFRASVTRTGALLVPARAAG